MKTMASRKGCGNIAVWMMFLLTASCLDYNVKTTVNHDGSVTRIYRVKGDSSEIFRGSLMIPSGPEWKITSGMEPDEKNDSLSGKRQFVYEASRTFKNMDALSAWLETDTSAETIRPAVNLKKKFRWFYTYYEYSEIYPMSFPFQKIPIDSFLTDMEQSVFLDDDRTAFSVSDKKMVWREKDTKYTYSPSDSAEMKKINENCEKKLGNWMVASIIEEYADILNKHFKNETVARDIIAKKSLWTEVAEKRYSFQNSEFVSAEYLSSIGDSLTGSGRLKELYASNPEEFAEFDRKIKKAKDLSVDDSYTHILSLPGKVYGTNSENAVLKDNDGPSEIEWKVEPMFFALKDYEMKASSRAANPWIMVLTGLIAVGLVWVVFRGRK